MTSRTRSAEFGSMVGTSARGRSPVADAAFRPRHGGVVLDGAVGDGLRLGVEVLEPDGDASAVSLSAAGEGEGDPWRFAGAAAGISVELRIRQSALAEWDLTLMCASTAGDPIDRGLRVVVDLPTVDAPPWWLIPGLFYGENRPVGCRVVYPRYERGTRRPSEMVSERWSFRSDRAATPAVFAWSGGRMAALATDERSDLCPTGMGLEGSATRTRIWVDLPFREEPIAYRGYAQPDAADVRTHAWRPAEPVSVTVRLTAGGG